MGWVGRDKMNDISGELEKYFEVIGLNRNESLLDTDFSHL